jgi:hypothetical protein
VPWPSSEVLDAIRMLLHGSYCIVHTQYTHTHTQQHIDVQSLGRGRVLCCWKVACGHVLAYFL